MLCTYSLYELPHCEGDPWHAVIGIDSISTASPSKPLRSIKMSLPTCKFQVCQHSTNDWSCDNHTGDLCSNFRAVQLNPTGVYGSVATYECGVAPGLVPTVSPTSIPTLMPTSEPTPEPTPSMAPTPVPFVPCAQSGSQSSSDRGHHHHHLYTGCSTQRWERQQVLRR